MKDSTETVKEAFVRLAKAPTEELNVNYWISLAVIKGFLRRRKNQGWLFNGKPVATTESQLTAYFLDPANQDDYFELENLVGDTKQDITSGTGSKTEPDSE